MQDLVPFLTLGKDEDLVPGQIIPFPFPTLSKDKDLVPIQDMVPFLTCSRNKDLTTVFFSELLYKKSVE